MLWLWAIQLDIQRYMQVAGKHFIISPYLFNICINQLLIELQNTGYGVNIGQSS